MESLKSFQWESFIPEKIIFAPSEGIVYIRKRWFNKHALIKAKEKQVFVDDTGKIVDLKNVSYNIHDRISVDDNVLNDILSQITAMIHSKKVSDSQKDDLKDKFDLVYHEKEFRRNFDSKLDEAVANGLCEEEANLSLATIYFMGRAIKLHDRKANSLADLVTLRANIDANCTDANKDEILEKIDKELAFRNALDSVLVNEDLLRDETVTLTISLFELLYTQQNRIIPLSDTIKKEPSVIKKLSNFLPRFLIPGEKYMRIDPLPIMINTSELTFTKEDHNNNKESFRYDVDFYLVVSDYKAFASFVNTTTGGIDEIVKKLTTSSGSAGEGSVAYSISDKINKYVSSLSYDEIISYCTSNIGLTKRIYFNVCDEINAELEKCKTGLSLDHFVMKNPIVRDLDKQLKENAEKLSREKSENKVTKMKNDRIRMQLEPLKEIYGDNIPETLIQMIYSSDKEHAPKIYNISGLANALAGLAGNNSVNNNRYTIDTLRTNIASEVALAQSVIAQTNQDVNNIDLITSLLSIKHGLDVAAVKNEVSSYINSMSNTNNNQNNSGNNNADEVIDKFIIMGYNFFKQNVPGKTDEEYAESVAHEVESNFGLSADEALELVRNKLGIVSPVNNIITQDDLNNARQYLVDNGLSDESITDDNLAEVIVFFNRTLDKAQVLAAIRNMTGTDPAITAAVEQIKNEGGVFILNENLFADKLISILTTQGITIDKDTAKGYFSSLNRGGHSM